MMVNGKQIKGAVLYSTPLFNDNIKKAIKREKVTFMKNGKKINITVSSILIGLVIAVLSFINMYVSVRYVLLNSIDINNLIAHIVLSLVLGIIGGIFFYFRFWLAFYIYIICTAVGFIQMYRMFLSGIDGWGDLAGFLSLLTWIIIGFIVGIGVQFFMFLFKRLKNKR